MAGLVAGLLLLASQPAEGCSISVSARADESFAEAGWEATPQRLRSLSAQVRERFAAAARRLCVAGTLKPSDLARFRALIVQNGEGATEPLLYREPSIPPRTFVFQYAFQNGGPPAPAEFERALRCWKRPSGPGCDAGD